MNLQGVPLEFGAITGILKANNTIENCFYKVHSCDKGIFSCYDNENEHCTTFEDSDSSFEPLSILGSDFRMKESWEQQQKN